MKCFIICSLVIFNFNLIFAQKCGKSVTTASGTKSRQGFCSGDLIFEENFEEFDLDVWEHEQTLSGGGNWEFQWYTNNRSNSFVKDGTLFIRPTLTADTFDNSFLYNGNLNINGGAPADQCTNAQFWGCERQGTATNILNPVKSARIRSINSFSFKYGKAEVRAKLPAGDWLWPAIWLLPRQNAYNGWPGSGEIDMMESRGNRKLKGGNVNIGVEQIGSTLHFGPFFGVHTYKNFVRNSAANQGFDKNFHSYQMEWTPDKIKFFVDGNVVGEIAPSDKGFWEQGGFGQFSGIDNPWRGGTKMAPFDKEFYFIFNLAVGGTNGYFPDGLDNGGPNKPWSNQSPTAMKDFWEARADWLPTWNLDKDFSADASLQIDYVRVWAL